MKVHEEARAAVRPPAAQRPLAEPEVPEDEQNDDYESDDIDDRVHVMTLQVSDSHRGREPSV
jgi:hypothetical protein